MGNKSQRRKERHAKKREEKRKKLAQSRDRRVEFPNGGQVFVGSSARHRQRLSQQVPQAWAGEAPADAAILDDSVLAGLPPELSGEASLIRDALLDATESRGDEAVKRVSVIARSSPYSDWRLFIRGLVDWLAGDTATANEAWQRLDPDRRPGRIAAAMMLALRTDLEQLTHAQGSGEPDASQPAKSSQWDDQLIYHAKLVRRVRIDRAALRIAETGLALREELQEVLLGPEKLQWLRQFCKEYGEIEPDLVAALSQAALGRAFAQNFTDVFSEAVKVFPGPQHDRRNLLLTFFFYSRFVKESSAGTKSERALDEYLNFYLPRNEALSEPLRRAIASQIHCCEATDLMTPDSGFGMLDRIFGPREDAQAIRKHWRAAAEAWPGNRSAYHDHAEWLKSKLDDDRLTQVQRAPLERELADVMRSWSKALPDDVEPRLWLVDYLLEAEQLDEARPHVDYLAASRQDNPRVRAAPWKWQILEAMRLCRRKAWLAQVPACLDAAESLWPAWLPRQWLPYLRAAWTLRSGPAEAFETERQQICQVSGVVRDSLADACMMLGAAQQMRAPAADLKRLRAPVDQALKSVDSLSLEELVAAGSFFWDLHRTQLLYPAYRMHGSKFGKALIARWKATPGPVLEGLEDAHIQKAVLWCSENRFWSSQYQVTPPAFFFHAAIQRHPMFIAARLNAFLKGRYHWDSNKYRDLGTPLRDAARSQRDVYYRHWFVALADHLDEVLAAKSSPSFRVPFGDLFGGGPEADEGGDHDDDLEFGDSDFNPECDCPKCRAARRASQESRSAGDPTLF